MVEHLARFFKTHLDIPFANNFHLHYKNKTITPLDYPARVAMRVNVNESDFNREVDLISVGWSEYPDFTVSKRQSELSLNGQRKLKRHMLHTITTDTSSLRLLNNNLIQRNNHRYDDLTAGFSLSQVSLEEVMYTYEYLKKVLILKKIYQEMLAITLRFKTQTLLLFKTSVF